MKRLLICLLLLSFVVNAYSQCNPNEVFDEQAQKCEKICEEGLIFNQETSNCEVNTTCPEGQTFNNETSTCEEIKIEDKNSNKSTGSNDDENNGNINGNINNGNNSSKPKKENNITCKGGK